MTTTLLVSYTPRLESNTAKLVQTFIHAVQEQTNLTFLDLAKTPAPLLLAGNLNALLIRNFMGMPLTDDESLTVTAMDVFLQQFQAADRIVVAFPMYNFSLPAAVKAWLDAIIQHGQTFRMKDDGSYEGLCQGKKVLILMTTGGDFSLEAVKSLNFAEPLMQTCMGFMGVESHAIHAYGLNQYPDRIDSILAEAQNKLIQYVNSADWR